MLIDLMTSTGRLEYEVLPSVTCETYCEFNDFPEFHYNSDIDPISPYNKTCCFFGSNK